MSADLFAQAPPADPVASATKHGATFEQRADAHGNHWLALAHRRGRPVALFDPEHAPDADTADAIVQFAVFGELVFG